MTTVNAGGPADGLIKSVPHILSHVVQPLDMHTFRVGDILEGVNGQNMANADHREAVRAVKESKGAVTVVRVFHCLHHRHRMYYTPTQIP